MPSSAWKKHHQSNTAILRPYSLSEHHGRSGIVQSVILASCDGDAETQCLGEPHPRFEHRVSPDVVLRIPLRSPISQGSSTARPTWRASCLAAFTVLPVSTTFPMITHSSSSGLSFVRTAAYLAAPAPQLGPNTSFTMQPKVPFAVRRGS